MSSSFDFVQFVLDQIDGCFPKRHRMMFGEYAVYVNGKPIILICDNTVYVKAIEELEPLLKDARKGYPYEGAKLRYILDPDNRALFNDAIQILERQTPPPRPKAGKPLPESDAGNGAVFSKRKVFEAARKIPYGKVSTYKEISKLLGNPKYARAVGNCLHTNRDVSKTPCYRVVHSDMSLSDNFGLRNAASQKELLEKEGIEVVGNKVSRKYFVKLS